MATIRHFLLSLLTSALGGALGWFVYLGVLKATCSPLSGSAIAAEIVTQLFLQLSVTAVGVFAAMSVLIAALSRLRWWMHWLAFVSGIVVCVAMRVHPAGIELTIDIFLHIALVSAVLSSGVAAHLLSRYLGSSVSAKK